MCLGKPFKKVSKKALYVKTSGLLTYIVESQHFCYYWKYRVQSKHPV